MPKHVLTVERVLSIPIREVSGLCIHTPSGGAPRLVAIGDATQELAWAPLLPGEEPRWEVADLTALGIADAGRGSQFEAIATDAAGLVLILREYPAFVYVIDPRTRRLATEIELVVRDHDGLRPPRARAAASLGEAMQPLKDGRLLVSKEKDPPLLFEFGLPGEQPLGIDGDRLLGSERPGRSPKAGDRAWRPWRAGRWTRPCNGASATSATWLPVRMVESTSSATSRAGSSDCPPACPPRESRWLRTGSGSSRARRRKRRAWPSCPTDGRSSRSMRRRPAATCSCSARPSRPAAALEPVAGSGP